MKPRLTDVILRTIADTLAEKCSGEDMDSHEERAFRWACQMQAHRARARKDRERAKRVNARLARIERAAKR